jgi:glucose/arabinose dehydrogenase
MQKGFTVAVMFAACVVVLLLGTGAMIAQETVPTEEAVEVVLFRDGPPDASQFTLTRIVGGLPVPLYITAADDDTNRLFIVGQAGTIWLIRDGQFASTPFLDLSGIVSNDVLSGYSERGLLGLAFHPDYEDNGFFYVNYTDRNGTSHVARYSVSVDDPDRADPSSEVRLLTVAQPYPNHNGGHMDFGPDGYLYISLGDGGSADDPLENGQNRRTLLGKILRIDVDNPTATRPYGIPQDNPFYTDPTFAPEVFHYGLRNVWRFSFDRATGDLYLGDVGQNMWEEVNFLPAGTPGGVNFGWRAYEGLEPYLGQAVSDVTMPFAVYPHNGGSCSVTGGYVYRGTTIPTLAGAYLYGDYCSGVIWAAWRDGSEAWQSEVLIETGRRISSFGEDQAGALYLVDYDGDVLRFDPLSQ